MNLREPLINSGVPVETVDKFLRYHTANPDIWKSFERAALDLIWSDVKHWGAKALIEVIRYERAKEGKDGFVVNNNYAPYYARAFILKYPEYKAFFETREIKGIAA